jgi:hypothetical protein
MGRRVGDRMNSVYREKEKETNRKENEMQKVKNVMKNKRGKRLKEDK